MNLEPMPLRTTHARSTTPGQFSFFLESEIDEAVPLTTRATTTCRYSSEPDMVGGLTFAVSSHIASYGYEMVDRRGSGKSVILAAVAVPFFALPHTAAASTSDALMRAPVQSVICQSVRDDLVSLYRIRELAGLTAGWDGPDSVGPSAEAVRDAEEFVRKLALAGPTRPPSIGAAADGEINFYWETPFGILDLGFFGDGTYSYYGRLEDGTKFSGDDVSASKILPAPLLEMLLV